MKNCSDRDTVQRQALAVGLCFASATFMAIGALHPSACAWMGFNAEQTFKFDMAFAAASSFLGAYILAQLAGRHSKDA